MTSDQIITDPSRLREACEEVDDILGEGLDLVDRLRASLAASYITGVGLAANQIGVSKRVFIMDLPEDGIYHGYAFINPVVSDLKEPIVFDEGCLSYPGITLKTVRYNRATIKDSLNPEGYSFTGLAAVIIQHETDHLNGSTMEDSQVTKMKSITRCRCGSGKAFKRCCLTVIKAGEKNG